MKVLVIRTVLIACLVIGGALPAGAVIEQAVSYTTYNSGSTQGGNVSVGFDFTTDKDIFVTHVGYWDQFGFSDPPPFGAGLLEAHEVGIYNIGSQTLVAPSWTVLPGGLQPAAGTSPNGLYRYADIANLFLPDGTYRIVATTGAIETRQFGGPASNLSYGPGISIGDSFQSSGGPLLSFPTLNIGSAPDVIVAGPNFQFEVVPEPSTVVLLLTGGFCLFRYGRSRRLMN